MVQMVVAGYDSVVCCTIQELSPLLPKALDMNIADEESMDGPSSVDQSLNDTCSYQGDSVVENTPTSSKKKKVVVIHHTDLLLFSFLGRLLRVCSSTKSYYNFNQIF